MQKTKSGHADRMIDGQTDRQTEREREYKVSDSRLTIELKSHSCFEKNFPLKNVPFVGLMRESDSDIRATYIPPCAVVFHTHTQTQFDNITFRDFSVRDRECSQHTNAV